MGLLPLQWLRARRGDPDHLAFDGQDITLHRETGSLRAFFCAERAAVPNCFMNYPVDCRDPGCLARALPPSLRHPVPSLCLQS